MLIVYNIFLTASYKETISERLKQLLMLIQLFILKGITKFELKLFNCIMHGFPSKAQYLIKLAL